MEETVGRSLATGNTAEIFEWGSRVLKLYKAPTAKGAVFHEAAASAAAEALGLPVPKIWGVREIGGRWGLVFDRVMGNSFAEQMLGKGNGFAPYLDGMVRLHIQVHAHRAIEFADLKVALRAKIAAIEVLDKAGKQGLLDALADLPEGDRLCHGDFHPLNILGDIDRPMIIDWRDARRGDPAADVCRSYLLLKLHAPQIATAYLDAYCRRGNVDRPAVLRWLPCLAAAKLAEGVPGERDGLVEIIASSFKSSASIVASSRD
jgi:Phosphotransferase enzyme family